MSNVIKPASCLLIFLLADTKAPDDGAFERYQRLLAAKQSVPDDKNAVLDVLVLHEKASAKHELMWGLEQDAHGALLGAVGVDQTC